MPARTPHETTASTSGISAGAALSLTGRFAVQGDRARRGLTLWAEHMQAAGGLVVRPGEPPRAISLRVYDDASTRAGAASATERLTLEERVELLFSPYSSVLALAAAEVSERYGRVLWNHGGSSDAIDRAGFRRVVSFLTPASRYFAPVLDLAIHLAVRTNHPPPTVALLYGAAGTFPKAVADGARAHAATLGLGLILDQPYPDLTPPAPLRGANIGFADIISGAERGEQETGAMKCAPTAPPAVGAHFMAPAGELAPPGSEVTSALARLRPDLILGVGTTEADLTFARLLRAHGPAHSLVALVAAPIEHFRETLGPDSDGFLGPSQWEPISGAVADRPDIGPTSAEFLAAFRRRFGAEPDYPAAQAYAAGLVAAHAVTTAGTLNDDAVRAAVAALDLTTFYGRFRLDPNTGQQIGHEMVVVQWQGDRKQIVWPPAVTTASLQPLVPTAAPTPRPSDAEASS